MNNTLFQWINQYFSEEMAVFLVSTLPVVELRGAIPLAIGLDMNPWKAYWLAVLGNMLPVVPLLLFLVPVRKYLREHSEIMDKFFSWLEKRALDKGDKVERYGAIGLMLFTAIPLPTTGAWTASLLAVLFRIKFRYAFPAILMGVLLAGIIMIILSLTGKAIL
ncbi:MAG: small multi-drug export protein [Halanaerobiaceae bacterium]|nr:small multi-drug export protein [Halanaerobiaceae bacterium]